MYYENEDVQTEQTEYPWLIFKLCGEYFTFTSELVSSIMMLPQNIVPMPNSPQYVRGIFDLRGKIIPLIELRRLFGMKSLTEEYQEFADMLEARKQDHLHWVKELERSVKQNEPFTLATDPHQCAFGKWYDNFESDLHTINHHMRKIDEPHTKLHQTALEVEECKQNCDDCERDECLKKVFGKLSDEYVPQIVSLLDEAKELFKIDFHEMVIVLEKDDQYFGIMADEIVSVEDLEEIGSVDNMGGSSESDFISGVRKSKSVDKSILVIDESALISTITGKKKVL
ncbi:chemotaxis protein CheW [Hydrogenoanaerobacterium sp.]|uniref:chemotaxis protein CheW n=1 Tax=Hydrogenoanaerobacterium sp. TaxID=2953763 RepID=UPI002899C55A|nr:chemotaxis protein CheW [Hydrogenoanaerobacterium sp.]